MDFQQALQPAAVQEPIPGQSAPVEGQQPPAAEGAAAETQQQDNQPTANPSEQSQSTNSAPTGAPKGGNTPDQQQQQQAYNDYLDKMSGGRIKDEAALKAVLPILEQYPTLKEQHEELSAKMAKAPVFADDEVRIYNELKANGATKEQITTFLKLGQLGNLSEMSDRDAIIANMIFKGTKESAAGYKVDRDFKVGDESLSEQEREILDDDMRIAGEAARKELEKFKATVSEPAVEPEEVRLQHQAKTLAHQAAVKPYVTDVMASIPHLGVFNLSGKDGKDAVNFELPIDNTIRTQLGQYVENYFMDGLTPVTEKSTQEALNYARAEYFRQNADKILQLAFEHGVSRTTEQLVAKYENRSGLKPQVDNPIKPGTSEAASMGQFMQNVAERKL